MHTRGEPNYPETVYEIVGVVKDTKYADVREEIQPIAYVPVTQHPALRPFPGIAIRSTLPPSELVPEVRRRLVSLNADLVLGFNVFETQMRDRLVRERTMAWLAGGFGLLATLMSTIGLYGVISYMTVRRRQEIAIRRALGARRSTIVSLILSETALTLAVGIPLGAAASAAAVRGAGRTAVRPVAARSADVHRVGGAACRSRHTCQRDPGPAGDAGRPDGRTQNRVASQT